MTDTDHIIEARIEEAILEQLHGRTEEAEKILKELLSRYPRSSEAWLWLGRVVSDESKKEECYKRAIRCDAGNIQAQDELVQLKSGKDSSPATSVPIPFPSLSEQPEQIQKLQSPEIPAIQVTTVNHHPAEIKKGPSGLVESIQTPTMPTETVKKRGMRPLIWAALLVGAILVCVSGGLLVAQAFNASQTSINGLAQATQKIVNGGAGASQKTAVSPTVSASQNKPGQVNPAVRSGEPLTPDNITNIKQLAKWGIGNGYQSKLVISPDGRLLVVRTALSLDIYDLRTIKLKKSIDLNEMEQIKLDVGVMISDANPSNLELKFSPSGKYLMGSYVGQADIMVWSTDTWKETPINFESHGYAFIFLNDQYGMAYMDYRAGITIYDLQSGQAVNSYPDLPVMLTAVASPDGQQAAIAGKDNSIYIIQPGSGKVLQTFADLPSMVFDLAFSPDGSNLAGRTQTGWITVWNIASGNVLAKISPQQDGSSGLVVFSPDGSLFASVDDADNKVKVWQTEGGALMQSFLPSLDYVETMGFSPDGSSLVASGQGAIYAWRLADGLEIGQPVKYEEYHGNTRQPVYLSPAGDWLAWQGADPTWHIVDTRTMKESGIIDRYSAGITTVDVTGTGKTLAVGYDDAHISLFDVQSGKLVNTLAGQSNISQVAFSPDGLELAAGYTLAQSPDRDVFGQMDSTLELWGVKNGEFLNSLGGQSGGGAALISPDGSYAAALSGNSTVRVWRVRDGAFMFASPMANTAEFSPDGTQIAVAMPDYSVHILESKTGKLLQTIDGHTGFILVLRYSPDGKLLASEAEDSYLTIWNLEDGHTVVNSLLENGYGDIAFLPGSRYFTLYTAGRYELRQISDGATITTLPDNLNRMALAPDGSGGAVISDVDFEYKVVVTRFNNSDSLVLGQGDTGQELEWQVDRRDQSAFTALAYSGDAQRLLTATEDGRYVVWNLTSHQIENVVQVPTSGEFRNIAAAAWSADGKVIAFADSDAQIALVDATSALLIRTLSSPTSWGFDPSLKLSLSNDGQRLYLAGNGHQGLWNLAGDGNFIDISGCIYGMMGCSAIDNNLDVYTTQDGAGQVILNQTGNDLSFVLMGSASDTILALDFSQDGKVLAAGGAGQYGKRGLLTTWDTTSKKVVFPLIDFGNEGESIDGEGINNNVVDFSLDGAWVAAGGSEGILRIWSMRDGSLQLRLHLDTGGILSLAFTADGQSLLVFTEKGQLITYQTSNWDITNSFSVGGNVNFTHALVCPDGGFFVGSFSSFAQIFSTTDGKYLGALLGHETQITALKITQDRKMIISSSMDGTVRFWGLAK